MARLTKHYCYTCGKSYVRRVDDWNCDLHYGCHRSENYKRLIRVKNDYIRAEVDHRTGGGHIELSTIGVRMDGWWSHSVGTAAREVWKNTHRNMRMWLKVDHLYWKGELR